MKIYKVALILLIIPFGFSAAQDMPSPERSKHLEKIEQMENAKIIQVLNLSEETALRFFARRKDYREEVKNLLEKRRKLMDNIDELLKSAEKENNSAYKEKLEELITIEGRFVKDKRNFYKSLNNILSAKQMVQLVLFEDRFRREIRETLMKRNRAKQDD